jgi:uncharacterized DUF497 family protein
LEIIGFIWLETIIDKLSHKHNVMYNEVEEVFANQPLFRFVEKGQQLHEDLYAALGQTLAGRYLIVYYIYKKDRRALIISARDMTQREKKNYERR